MVTTHSFLFWRICEFQGQLNSRWKIKPFVMVIKVLLWDTDIPNEDKPDIISLTVVPCVRPLSPEATPLEKSPFLCRKCNILFYIFPL